MVCVAASQFAVQESRAQSAAEGIFGLVGGMIAAAQAQAAQEAWSNLPEFRQYCFQRALSRRNTNVTALIRAGVMPNDPRLSPITADCARFEPSVLKSNYRCSIYDETGSLVTSTCNQVFARQDNAGRTQPVDPRVAVDLYFSNGSYLLLDAETDAGRVERHERAEGYRRIADLMTLREEVESFKASRSDMVRAQTQSLMQRVSVASNPNSPPSEASVEAIRRDYQLLVQLEQTEIARLAALDKLNTVKAGVERRATSAPLEVRDEMERLQAEYLAIVNRPPPALPTRKPEALVGPSFDCDKAKVPLDRVICSDAALKRLDIELIQPYYILRHANSEQRNAFKQEAVAFTQQVLKSCRIPEKGNIAPAAMKKAVPCVTAEYRRQRDLWRSYVAQSVQNSGLEEASRPVDDHVHLQKLLQEAGFIPADEKVDGVYGAATRTAISSFQSAEGLPSDGLLSKPTAERLIKQASFRVAGPGARSLVDQSDTGRIVDLHRRYVAVAARLDELDVKRAREEQLTAKITAGKSYAKDALALSLPAPIQASLSRFLSEAEAVGDQPDGAVLSRLASEFDALKPAAEEAVTIAKATTPKNGFVVQGDLDDIIVLVNDTGKAPSVVKNLRGDFVFESGKTAACQPQGGLNDITVTRQVNARLGKWSQSLKFPLARCNPRNLSDYDLIVLSRGGLLKEKASDLVGILSAVDAGVFDAMFMLTHQEVKAAIQAEAVRVIDIESAVEKERKGGFGVIVLSNRSGVVCQVVGDDREAHETLLRPHTGRVAEEVQTAATFVSTSADGAFVGVKRDQCGAVYASGSDLKDLTSALRRDQIAFRYLPIWIEPAELEAMRKSLAERKTQEVQQEADRRRRTEDEQRLAAAKANEESVVKAKRQEELQQQYGALARAFEGTLTNEFKDFVEGRSRRTGDKYPEIGLWYQKQLQDHWELMTVETSLRDYGVVDFKGRSLEAAFARTNIKMRNRILGEYKEHCFVTGFISDKEFEMEREPIGVTCDDPKGAVVDYRQGQRFTSRWLVP